MGCRSPLPGIQTRCHLAPGDKGPIPKESIMRGSHQMPSDPEEIVDRSMDREEALNVACGFKATHVAFALSGGLMRHFGSIAGVLRSTVMHGRHTDSVGRPITAQLIKYIHTLNRINGNCSALFPQPVSTGLAAPQPSPATIPRLLSVYRACWHSAAWPAGRVWQRDAAPA